LGICDTQSGNGFLCLPEDSRLSGDKAYDSSTLLADSGRKRFKTLHFWSKFGFELKHLLNLPCNLAGTLG
jgi:hypothetical protein